MKFGAWSGFKPITEETEKVLKAALDGLKGVDYEGFAVAQQVVEGFNYKFLCNATPVSPDPCGYVAEILVYLAPMSKTPVIVDIRTMDC